MEMTFIGMDVSRKYLDLGVLGKEGKNSKLALLLRGGAFEHPSGTSVTRKCLVPEIACNLRLIGMKENERKKRIEPLKISYIQF